MVLSIQIQLSEKRKNFSNFLFHFFNLHQIFDILKKKMIVVANVFPKLGNVKILFGPLSKNLRFRTRFDSKHGKVSQILAKSRWERFCHVFSSYFEKVIRKMSSLLLGEVLVVLVNRLTPDGKYPDWDCENTLLSIKMQLSEKRKTFCESFVPFLESLSNFRHFEKHDDCHS